MNTLRLSRILSTSKILGLALLGFDVRNAEASTTGNLQTYSDAVPSSMVSGNSFVWHPKHSKKLTIDLYGTPNTEYVLMYRVRDKESRQYLIPFTSFAQGRFNIGTGQETFVLDNIDLSGLEGYEIEIFSVQEKGGMPVLSEVDTICVSSTLTYCNGS